MKVGKLVLWRRSSYIFKMDALKGGKYEFIRFGNKQKFKRDVIKLIFSLTRMQVS